MRACHQFVAVALVTALSQQLVVVVSAAPQIQHIIAPRQSANGGGPALHFKGNTAWPYGPCEGDCDSDADCLPGLSCFQRSGSTPVPGCANGGNGDRSDVDYCVGTPTSTNMDDADDDQDGGEEGELTAIAGDLESNILLSRCEADCDSDDECGSGLICYQRDDDEVVPGCNGTPRSGWDYCIRPSDLEWLEEMGDTDQPAMEETIMGSTEEPTRRPTVKPTMPPPGVVFSYPEGSEPGRGEMQRCMGDCDKGEWKRG